MVVVQLCLGAQHGNVEVGVSELGAVLRGQIVMRHIGEVNKDATAVEREEVQVRAQRQSGDEQQRTEIPCTRRKQAPMPKQHQHANG